MLICQEYTIIDLGSGLQVLHVCVIIGDHPHNDIQSYCNRISAAVAVTWKKDEGMGLPLFSKN